MMHVSVMLLSYAMLICGCSFSIAFIIIFLISKIKKQNKKDSIKINGLLETEKNKVFFLKSLDRDLNKIVIIQTKTNLLKNLDKLSFRLISLGFPLLTIGIISGSVWANESWGSYWNWDPKETWSLITWIIFAIYMHLRFNLNWRGLKSASVATLGFFIIWICFLGVNFLEKGLHSYGWFH